MSLSSVFLDQIVSRTGTIPAVPPVDHPTRVFIVRQSTSAVSASACWRRRVLGVVIGAFLASACRRFAVLGLVGVLSNKANNQQQIPSWTTFRYNSSSPCCFRTRNVPIFVVWKDWIPTTRAGRSRARLLQLFVADVDARCCWIFT
jgi:hypothetical protein